MIKVNELRIGNWVNLIALDQNIEIESVSKTSIGGLFTWVHDGKEYEDSLSGVEPIQLTPEILENCGFELGNDKEHWFIKHHGYCLIFDGDDYCLKMRCDEPYVITYCRHLHQLQNLYYALTGEEIQYTPNNEQNVQECDASKDAQGGNAGNQIG